MLTEFEAFARNQEQDWGAFQSRTTAMEARIAKLDPKLRPEALTEYTANIRRETEQELQSLLAAMTKRTKEAEESAHFHTPEAELRQARFHRDDLTNATMEQAYFARLGRTSTSDLIELLKDAVTGKNLAQVEAIRLEFTSRRDSEAFRDRYKATFGKVNLPRSKAARDLLGQIRSKSALAQERFLGAIVGRSDPVARMAAARLARVTKGLT